VAGSDDQCQESGRCQAIGTCILSGKDCCTAATGGYCNGNEVRFEQAQTAAKRAERCRVPPPFQGARHGTEAFSLNGDGVSPGTTRSYGFGDAVLRSESEDGVEVYVLFARDVCGLWLKRERSSARDSDPPRLRPSRWVRLKPNEEGRFVLRRLRVGMEFTQEGPGTFDATLLTRIRKNPPK
jgi:hypothetical protein